MNTSMGEVISTLRKKKGMTQNELATILKVTDKAVSKWERNVSCPDISLLPLLAKALDTTLEELLSAKVKKENKKTKDILNLIAVAIGLGMGICVIVTSLLNELDFKSASTMLGIGLFATSLYLLKNNFK